MMKKTAVRLIKIINGLLIGVLIFLAAAFAADGFEGKPLKPYAVSFGDDIAIRCLHDGRIEATVEAYEKAEWEAFQETGSTWAEPFTDEEYKALMAQYDSVNSFAAMQKDQDYVDVSAGVYGTLAAVHADGSVSFNKRAEDRYGVSAQDPEWQNIREMELGGYVAVALRNDGTAAAKVKREAFDFTEGTRPETWKNVQTISNDHFAVGLRSDGTVCWAGVSRDRQPPQTYIPLETISGWTDMVQVDTANETVAGLRADGTVALAGDTGNGIAEAAEWKDISRIAVGMTFVAGLKEDGTLVSTAPWAIAGGEKLKNVADIYANRRYVLAVLKNGTTRLLGKPEDTFYDGAWPADGWTFPR